MPIQAYSTPADTGAAKALLQGNITEVQAKAKTQLEGVKAEPERRLTEIPSALQVVTAPTDKYNSLHEVTGKSLSEDVEEVLKYLANRSDPKFGDSAFDKTDTKMSDEELQAFNKVLDKIQSDPGINANSKDKAIALLLSKLVETSLESRSFQFYQLTTFTRLLDFIQNKINDTETGEDTLNTLMSWAGNTKYQHYISAADNGRTLAVAESPLHAIQLVMERVHTDLESGDQIRPETARNMAALTTVIASIFSSDMKADATKAGLDPRAPDKLNSGRPTANPSTVKAFLTGKNPAGYAKVEEDNKKQGEYPSSMFGPSMTAFRTVRFIEVELGGTRQEQAVYAATQGNDWDVNSHDGGKYQRDFTKFHFGGAHSVFEALMTKDNAVGFEPNLNTTRQTLMRLFGDMNVTINEGVISVERKNVAPIDQPRENSVVEDDEEATTEEV